MIAVLCPTRDGVGGTHKAYTSMLKTSESTTMIVCADDDQKDEYGVLDPAPRMRFSYGPKADIVKAVNRGVAENPDFDAYGLIVDDAEFTAPNWDVYVSRRLESFSGRIGVVSAAHTLGAFVNFGYVSKRWIDTLGWYACPDTQHYCWDTVLEMLGEATEIDYAPRETFYIQHNHVPKDKTLPVFMMDAVQFLGWCVNKRRETVMKLREAAIA